MFWYFELYHMILISKLDLAYETCSWLSQSVEMMKLKHLTFTEPAIHLLMKILRNDQKPQRSYQKHVEVKMFLVKTELNCKLMTRIHIPLASNMNMSFKYMYVIWYD